MKNERENYNKIEKWVAVENEWEGISGVQVYIYNHIEICKEYGKRGQYIQ